MHPWHARNGRYRGGIDRAGKTIEDVLAAYPYLERQDVLEALAYAAWRSEEREFPLAS